MSEKNKGWVENALLEVIKKKQILECKTIEFKSNSYTTMLRYKQYRKKDIKIWEEMQGTCKVLY